MTPERLAEIRERLRGADSAEWDISVEENGLRIDALGDGYGPDGADAWFLTHIREDVADLLAEVERLRVALEGIAHQQGTMTVWTRDYARKALEGGAS